MARLSLLDVLEHDCLVKTSRLTNGGSISSPLRRDSSPSFIVYHHPDEDDGVSPIDDSYSAYDFGTGKSYNPINLIHEYKGHSNWAETFNYLRDHYGVEVKKTEYVNDNQLPQKLILLINSLKITKPVIPVLENAILQYLKGNKSSLEMLIPMGELVI